ncbi:MAG: NHL repeat-containing protein, partial [Bacteroidales bacterium]|nr:NHL repeat-containing protein [Bacteroidales bacterium]
MKILVKILFYPWIAISLFTATTTAQNTSFSINALSEITEGVFTPIRIAVNFQGTIYITDAFNNTVSKYDVSGNFLETIDVVDLPVSVALNSEGELFIGDGATGHIYKYNETVGATEFYTGTEYPTSMVFSPDNTLYVSDSKQQQVVVIDLSGNLVQTIGNGILDFPTGIALDNNDKRIFVGEHGGKGTGFSPVVKVWIFDFQGNLINSFGNHGNSDGKFYRVQGLTVGKCGYIYVVDPFLARISIFDENGNYKTKFGEWGPQPGQLNIPMDIVYDSQDRLMVTSLNNSAIGLFSISDTLPCSNIKSGNAMICNGETTDIEIAFEGTAPWTFTYTTNGINPQTITTSNNPYILT